MSAPENTVEIPKSHVAICISIDSDIEKCTEEQKNIIIQIYSNAKETVETIAAISELSDMVKIVKMIGGIIKLLETATYNNAKISGKNKKHIAIVLTKKLLQNCLQSQSIHNNIYDGIMQIYDSVSEQVLETMVDVSRNVNIAVQEAASTCCKEFGTAGCVSCITSLLRR